MKKPIQLLGEQGLAVGMFHQRQLWRMQYPLYELWVRDPETSVVDDVYEFTTEEGWKRYEVNGEVMWTPTARHIERYGLEQKRTKHVLTLSAVQLDDLGIWDGQGTHLIGSVLGMHNKYYEITASYFDRDSFFAGTQIPMTVDFTLVPRRPGD